MTDHRTSRATVAEDPLASLAEGEGIHIAPVDFGGSDASDVLNWVRNWDHFQGGLLAIIRTDGAAHVIFGTAAMVAPGVAVSATHVFDEDAEALLKTSVRMYALGMRDGTMDVWEIRKINTMQVDDLCLLSLVLASELPSDHTFRQFPVTVRAPRIGESVHLIGIAMGQASDERGIEDVEEVAVAGNLFASQGTVTDFYPTGRDHVLVPYAAFHVSAGSLGGMSGGVAVTEEGHVIGIISRGYKTEDMAGPTVVSWIAFAVTRPLEYVWPRGLLPDHTALRELDERFVFLNGREKVSVDEAGRPTISL